MLVLLCGLVGFGVWFFMDIEIQKATYCRDTSDLELKVAYSFAPQNLNPWSNRPEIAEKLHGVLEGLTAFDQNLRVIPQVALSWGQLDPLTWKFIIRSNIYFHDGVKLSVSDIEFSLKQAKNSQTSELHELLSSVESIEVINESEILIKLSTDDPLLLSKLTKIPIVPENFSANNSPIGTGPYEIFNSRDLSKIELKRFEKYYGDLPVFEKLTLYSGLSKSERISGLINGDYHFLANVPPDSVEELKKNEIFIKEIPSLEVGFLAFNLKDPIFQDLQLRKSLALGLDREVFIELAQGYAQAQSQFISSGIFGYNPQIIWQGADAPTARQKIKELSDGFSRIEIDFYFPENIPLLGQFVSEQVTDLGLDINLKPVSNEELAAGIRSGNFPFYYLGWKSDLGDSLPFLLSVAHSRTNNRGEFNGMNWNNSQIDQQISEALKEGNLRKRQKIQQDIMKVMVEEEVVGIPLFETSSIFAFRNFVDFTPRIDGQVFPQQIYLKTDQ